MGAQERSRLVNCHLEEYAVIYVSCEGEEEGRKACKMTVGTGNGCAKGASIELE